MGMDVGTVSAGEWGRAGESHGRPAWEDSCPKPPEPGRCLCAGGGDAWLSCCRFGVSELVDLCEQVPFVMDAEGGQGKEQEDNADSRVETFRELLHFVWLGEGEGAKDLLMPEGHEEDREKVKFMNSRLLSESCSRGRKLQSQREKPTCSGRTVQFWGKSSQVNRIKNSQKMQSRWNHPGKEEMRPRPNGETRDSPHSCPPATGL